MKISCQSCEAKYTIADEKVRGKVVKIRCRKCNSTIVVKGTDLPAPAAVDYDDAPTRVIDRDSLAQLGPGPAEEWTINVSEEEQRPASTEELLELYQAGTIDGDTYVWRDGMDDWLPLDQVQVLADGLARARRASAIPAQGRGPSPSSSDRAAVRRAASDTSSTDLFGTASMAGSEEDVFTSASPASSSAASPPPIGARNESSVLFSLDSLSEGNLKSPFAGSAEESSSIIDIKKLMGPSAGPSKPADTSSKVDDIMNLGAGGGIFAPSLAAPVLDASTPDPELPAGGGEADSEKSRKGLIIGAIGIAAAALLGAGLFLFAGGEGGDAPKEVAAASAEATPAPTDEAPDKAESPEPAATEGTAKADPPSKEDSPADESAAKAEGEEKSEVQAAVAEAKEKPAPPVPAKAPAEKREPSKPVTAVAKPAPPPTPSPAPKPAAEAPPFDRAAALSALNKATDASASCKRPDGPTGSGRVAVTFAPTGVVTTANVEGPPFAGTSVGSCIAARFRSARVPAFSGGMVTVRKSFTIN